MKRATGTKAAAIAALALSMAACAAPRAESHRLEVPPTRRPPSPTIEWRLAERAYGALDESWSGGLDGEIARDALALVYEPVLRSEKAAARASAPERDAPPCGHVARVEIEGGDVRRVGETACAVIRVDGHQAHHLTIEATSPAVRILSVEGASPVEGAPGTYRLPAGVAARVRFTSGMPMRAGLRVTVEDEILDGKGGGRPSAQE